MNFKDIRAVTIFFVLLFICHYNIFSEEKEDSVAIAFSSILASYLLEDLPNDQELKSEFIAGLKDSENLQKTKNYYIGILQGIGIGERIKMMQNMGLPIEETTVFNYLIDMLNDGNTGGFTLHEANALINNYFSDNIAQPDTVSSVSQRAFIDSVASGKDAVMYPSGIVIVPIKTGQSDVNPHDGDVVLVSYEGRLSDGTVFDKTEEPIEMTVGRLVPGFNEGLKSMAEGDTIRLVIPADLGYGNKGAGGVIPGNAALDFTITLEKILN